MENLVLFHTGTELPLFLNVTFAQIRAFNPEAEVYFLTDKQHLKNTLFDNYNIHALNKDDFYSDKIHLFEKNYKYAPDNFWSLTATRLIYIEKFMLDCGLENMYHFDNDVLLYYNLCKYHEHFKRLYAHIAITPGGPNENIAGFIFIKTGKSLADMTQFFVDTLQTYGMGAGAKYHVGLICEMRLMKIYEIEKGKEFLGHLPVLPFGKHSENYSEFNAIFDSASWGQFVGGTHKGKTPGAKTASQYVGQLLREHPEYAVIWTKDNEDRKIPYFKYDNNEVKINNLHIHSKQLSKYRS